MLYQNLFFWSRSLAFIGGAGAQKKLPGVGAKKKISGTGADEKLYRLRNTEKSYSYISLIS